MKSLVYCSESLIPINIEGASDIAHASARRNRRLGVSGYLCLKHNHFFQYIEGNDRVIDKLIVRIAQDERHDIISTHSESTHDKPRFSGWAMQYFDAESQHNSPLEKVMSDLFVNLTSAKQSAESSSLLLEDAHRKIKHIFHTSGTLQFR